MPQGHLLREISQVSSPLLDSRLGQRTIRAGRRCSAHDRDEPNGQCDEQTTVRIYRGSSNFAEDTAAATPCFA